MTYLQRRTVSIRGQETLSSLAAIDRRKAEIQVSLNCESEGALIQAGQLRCVIRHQ